VAAAVRHSDDVVPYGKDVFGRRRRRCSVYNCKDAMMRQPSQSLQPMFGEQQQRALHFTLIHTPQLAGPPINTITKCCITTTGYSAAARTRMKSNSSSLKKQPVNDDDDSLSAGAQNTMSIMQFNVLLSTLQTKQKPGSETGARFEPRVYASNLFRHMAPLWHATNADNLLTYLLLIHSAHNLAEYLIDLQRKSHHCQHCHAP